jgi:hypothetical protein
LITSLLVVIAGCEEYTEEELLKQALWETKLLAIEIELSYQGESQYRDTLVAEMERMQAGHWMDMEIPESVQVEKELKALEEITLKVDSKTITFHYLSNLPFGNAYKITGSSISITSLNEGVYKWRLYPLLQWNLGRPGDVYHAYLDRVVRVPD